MRETAKRLAVVSAIVAASAVPAMAQEGVTSATGAAQYGEEPAAQEGVSATFELAV